MSLEFNAENGEHEIQNLIQNLNSQVQDTRLEAVNALGKLGTVKALELLINLFAGKDENDTIRANALFAMVAARKDEQSFQLLIKALDEPSSKVRSYAVSALGYFGDKGVDLLISRLVNETWEVRCLAAYTLGEIGDLRAVEPLIALLKDSNKSVRLCAALALGKLKDVKAVEPLLAAIEDPEPIVRFRVAEALGQFKDPRILETLKLVAQRDKETVIDDESVRDAAIRSIRRITKAVGFQSKKDEQS